MFLLLFSPPLTCTHYYHHPIFTYFLSVLATLISLLAFCCHFTFTQTSTHQKSWKTLQNTIKAANLLKHTKMTVDDESEGAVESGDQEIHEEEPNLISNSCPYFPHKAALTSQHMLPLPSLKE